MGNGLATYYKTETRSNAYNTTDRYRFGGKELDTRGGLFHYDFGARHYDPMLPMFNGYDRRAEKYCHLSPFAYCAGNPIRHIDPSGEMIFMLFYSTGNNSGAELDITAKKVNFVGRFDVAKGAKINIVKKED